MLSNHADGRQRMLALMPAHGIPVQGLVMAPCRRDCCGALESHIFRRQSPRSEMPAYRCFPADKRCDHLKACTEFHCKHVESLRLGPPELLST